MDHYMTPTWRKPVGILLMLFYIVIWIIIVASLSSWIEKLHILIQTLFYVICGIIWIFPLKPMLFWMEHGKWPSKQER